MCIRDSAPGTRSLSCCYGARTSGRSPWGETPRVAESPAAGASRVFHNSVPPSRGLRGARGGARAGGGPSASERSPRPWRPLLEARDVHRAAARRPPGPQRHSAPRWRGVFCARNERESAAPTRRAARRRLTERSADCGAPEAALPRARVAEQRRAPSCLLYTSPSPRDATLSRMPSSA